VPIAVGQRDEDVERVARQRQERLGQGRRAAIAWGHGVTVAQSDIAEYGRSAQRPRRGDPCGRPSGSWFRVPRIEDRQAVARLFDTPTKRVIFHWHA
jgi:hypothetical protein